MDPHEIEEYLALHYPHAYYLLPDLDRAMGIVKTQNQGRGRIAFEAQGIDLEGKLIVKCIDLPLKLFRSKQETRPSQAG